MITFKDLKAININKFAKSNVASVFEWLHTGVALLSAQGVFLYANKSFLDMFGFEKSILGFHVSELFLTSEQGVMEAIRTREMTLCSSVTADNSQGVSFRYPVLDEDGVVQGVIIEAIPTSVGKEKLINLLGTIKNLEEKADYLEYKMMKKPGMLHTFNSLIGESKAMLEMKQQGNRFARSDEPILLFGESGTGKELVAQALHSSSGRTSKPFITVNCAALPLELIESELFGYEPGAFTGARASGMKGKFELADKGTIFLDEIGDLPLSMQAKLLRVLENGEVQKIGHSGRMLSDFRLIAATNKNLDALVKEGEFREDLYHRLNILELTIPPLRERTSDIPLLVRHFMSSMLDMQRFKEVNISREVYRIFSSYTWRGNIRELRNVLTFAVYDMDTSERMLAVKHLPARFLKEVELPGLTEPQPAVLNEPQKLSQVSAEAERKALLAALEKAHNNKSAAAQVLGISRNKLYKKMRDFNVVTK